LILNFAWSLPMEIAFTPTRKSNSLPAGMDMLYLRRESKTGTGKEHTQTTLL